MVITMTRREPKVISDLVDEFYDAVNRSGCDRQTAIDALEFALHYLLAECVTGVDEFDRYSAVMLDRGRFLCRLRGLD